MFPPSLTFLIFLLRNGDLLTVEQHVELLRSQTLLEFWAFGLLYHMADAMDKCSYRPGRYSGSDSPARRQNVLYR